MSTLALNMIVKDKSELAQVKNIINQYGFIFDEIVLAVDKNVPAFKTLENNMIKVYKYKWRDDFSHKRNFVASKTNSEFYMRLDCDDTLDNPEYVRKIFDEFAAKGGTLFYTMYTYAKDEWGNIIASHWRETIIKNDGNLYWNKTVHENILPRNKENLSITKCKDFRVIHNIGADHIMKSFERNFQILIKEYNKDKDKTDPRTICYLGKMLFGMAKFKEARFFLEKHIDLSGWDDDRYFSWCMLSDLHRMQENYDEAIGAAFEAINEKPQWCNGYFKLADAYFEQSKWQKALASYETGFSKDKPETMLIVDETDFTWKPLISVAFCYFHQSDFKKALYFFEKAEKFVPTLEVLTKNKHLFQQGYDETLFLEHLTWMVRCYEDTDKSKIVQLIDSIPNKYLNNEMVYGLRNLYAPPKEWNDKSIVFVCGGTAETWTPDSIKDGIGGSEEAMIHMGNELSKLGWEVTVYNDSGEKEGLYGAVQYIDVSKFNPNDKFNIIVGWRRNISAMVTAKKSITWIHDIPPVQDFTDNLVRQTDHIVMLSEYHKTLLPDNVPDEKVYISRNGVKLSDFDDIDEVRQPKRIIYASSYDRGLESLLTNWPIIKAAVPEAEIHIYYGWNTYDKYLKEGFIQDNGEWKKKMLKLMDQPGVHEHGRIGHKELLKEYAKSSILAYPCTYAGEIQCIAYTKAILSGCYPVTNDHPIFVERNIDGVVSTDSDFISSLITALSSPLAGRDYCDKERKYWDWSSVAQDWHDDILTDKPYDIVLENRVRWVRNNVTHDTTEKIVDIGCCEGHVLDKYDRTNITSVDLDDHGLPNYVKASADNLPFNDKEYDTALLCEILEHVPDPVKTIKEAMRVTKRLLITVPNEHEWDLAYKPFVTADSLTESTGKTKEELLEENPAYNKKDVKVDTTDDCDHLWHIRWYTYETLKKDLEDAGATNFKIVGIRHNNWSHFGVEVICP